MEDDFSLDFQSLGISNFEKPILTYEERTVKANQLRNEIAFHEASHFVFKVLGLAHVNEFTPINFAICCPNKVNQEGFNVVQGFAPRIPISETYGNLESEPKGLINFFNSDRKRLVASLFSKIAGYSSYQVFIKNSNFYISSKVEKTGKKCYKIKYYNLENATVSNTDDFNNIFRKLDNYYFKDPQINYIENQYLKDKKNETVKVLTDSVQQLMRQKAINDSIRMVKNQLLKTECQKIEGYRLAILVKKVKMMIKKIDITDILVNLKDEIKK
jgi:hypothetical protein